MSIWLRIISWAVAALGYCGILALIVVVPIIDKRDRRRLVDAIKQRGGRLVTFVDYEEGE